MDMTDYKLINQNLLDTESILLDELRQRYKGRDSYAEYKEHRSDNQNNGIKYIRELIIAIRMIRNVRCLNSIMLD